MAIYHLHVDVGSRSKGSASTPKHLYIAREGKYARSSTSGSKHAYISREGKYAGRDELAYLESGNMPSWAQNPKDFWKAVDTYERKDGVLYRQIEFALPRELSETQNVELAKKFTTYIAGDQHPYTLALHKGKGSNPHAHLLFSERINDGIERAPERWFGKYNTKHPEKGGAKKRVIGAERKEWLQETREAWTKIANEALERANRVERIDHRSYQEQGVDKIPGIHIGPNVLAMDQKARAKARTNPLMELIRPRRMAKILEIDQYRAKLEELKTEKERLIQAIQDGKNEREQEAADRVKTIANQPLRLPGLTIEDPDLVGWWEEHMVGKDKNPARALGIDQKFLDEIDGKLTPESAKKLWKKLVWKEESGAAKIANGLAEQRAWKQTEKLREPIRKEWDAKLKVLESQKPPPPPKWAIWKWKGYEKELASWEAKMRLMENRAERVLGEVYVPTPPKVSGEQIARKKYPIMVKLVAKADEILEERRKQEEKLAEERKLQERNRRMERLKQIKEEQEKAPRRHRKLVPYPRPPKPPRPW